ncbi:uncharacterized protein LOC115726866 isoform X2 [Rhodamnia argentea]|uniref:Uncharacterized protein LOC115726866 isoform X2 n=1 Tax=Rhodamnia argentea TaxID=178133 RepID=A0ABM3H5V0_9MYRT|nr:uncharacterized protein LOC115726866 isoform X2 [Rhodamnia argentea]
MGSVSAPFLSLDLEARIGWPLGLEIMNLRLRLFESLQSATVDPRSFRAPSTCFSSLSSSALDTESSASFFQDSSVSLGRLIGIRPSNSQRFYLPDSNSIRHEEPATRLVRGSLSEKTKGRRADVTRGICVPLLLSILVRITPSKSKPK